PMFVVEDDDVPVAAGLAGVFAWGSSDARFSDVRVYPPDQLFQDWLLDEPFEVLVPGRWTFVDEGNQAGPSDWKIIAGELTQTAGIFGEGPPGMPGTYALAGDLEWTDYRVSVRLRSEAVGTVGLMFRYQDKGNYYRFAIDVGQQGGGLG